MNAAVAVGVTVAAPDTTWTVDNVAALSGVGVKVAVCAPIDAAAATAVATFVGAGVGISVGNITEVGAGGVGVGVNEGWTVESAVAAVLESACPDSIAGEAAISFGTLVGLSPVGVAVAACRSLSSMDAATGVIVAVDLGVSLIGAALEIGEAAWTGAAGAAPHAGSIAAPSASATTRSSFAKS